jgi:hypothetical protein
MGQQPEERLDEDLEIDSDTAEKVTGGFAVFEIKTVDDHKAPAHHFEPEKL